MFGGIGLTLATVLPALAPAPLETSPAPLEASGETRERAPILSDRVRDEWLLALEGVTRAPIDVGVQAGVEAPFGLRLFGGYAWVPQVYIGTLMDIAASAAGDSRARMVLDSVDYSGRTLRVMLGVRPFSRLGLYLDAGYANVRLKASRVIPELLVPGVVLPRGGYRATTDLDLWVIELGYQLQFSRRFVLAAALGVTGTLDARTGIVPTGGAPNDPALRDGARQVDSAFERYGYVPTLTLRLGFDLI
jgi:hypothetical protein